MTAAQGNRFEAFFADDAYVALKNLLYNYRLRKRAVGAALSGLAGGRVLEVGSGLSPMVTGSADVVYSELSLPALTRLRDQQEQGLFVVADAMRLPFRVGSFDRVVCSEVLEHLPDDRTALREIAGVLKCGGSLILTFPHRRFYFAADDAYVGHLRRYELHEMAARLRAAGLEPVRMRKVLGPLEKLAMMAVIAVTRALQRFRSAGLESGARAGAWRAAVPLFKWFNLLLCVPMWLDAALMPRFLSTVVLIRAVKAHEPGAPRQGGPG